MIGQMQCVCEIHLYKSRIVDIEAVIQRYCMSERLRNTFGIGVWLDCKGIVGIEADLTKSANDHM